MKSERINFDGLVNCRDLGGFNGLNHKKTAYKKVFRSESLDRLSEKDKKKISQDLGIHYDIDLRSPTESKVFPDVKISGVDYVLLPLQVDKAIFGNRNHPEYDLKDVNLNRNIDFLFHWDENGSSLMAMRKNYREKITSEHSRKSYKEFFSLLAKPDSEAVLFHCHDGKDRTGILTMLYLGLLGVSNEDILDDYLASNIYTMAKKEARKKYFDEVIHLPSSDPMYDSLLLLTGVDQSWLLEAMDEVEKRGGYEEYLKHDVGLNEETIACIRNKYLH